MRCLACDAENPNDAKFCCVCGEKTDKQEMKELSEETMAIGKTCPYCQVPFKAIAEIVYCPQCKMPHHRDCWNDNGRKCTIFGCSGMEKDLSGNANTVIPHEEKVASEPVGRKGDNATKKVIAIAAAVVIFVCGAAYYYVEHRDAVKTQEFKQAQFKQEQAAQEQLKAERLKQEQMRQEQMKKETNNNYPTGKLVYQDSLLAGLRAGMNISEARRIIGSPLKSEKGKYGTIYTFPRGIEITTVDSAGKIGSIAVDEYGEATARGIRVGDSVERIIDKYGAATITNYDKQILYEYFYAGQPEHILRFAVNRNTKKIEYIGVRMR